MVAAQTPFNGLLAPRRNHHTSVSHGVRSGIDSTWLQPLAPQDRIPKRRWIRRFAEDVLKTLQSAGGDATGSVARDIESRQKAPAVGYATHTLALPPRKRLAIASGDTSARVAGRLPSVPPAAPPPPELPATVPAVDTPVKEPGGGGRPSAADTPGPSDRGTSSQERRQRPPRTTPLRHPVVYGPYQENAGSSSYPAGQRPVRQWIFDAAMRLASTMPLEDRSAFIEGLQGLSVDDGLRRATPSPSSSLGSTHARARTRAAASLARMAGWPSNK